ncbi:DUF3426 domain-containing protein [Undibacterium flavidum]|uniref:Zinc-ribbon domain-containing protein n=1 Tax=Undibacterium flavidum TaxID=2762297 RepID=A0ABR6YE58_9BURK|nr:DUF3426 domain-containing protein [Undibacterium flavidum]MBC3874850.1 zinc-ribbon domain-containing protein [Undibacterium flavidum]
MALATQCPHCYTSFRVANDQLKLHAGLVRCGSCNRTFNGIEYLLAPGEKPRQAPAEQTPVESTAKTSVTSDVSATNSNSETPSIELVEKSKITGAAFETTPHEQPLPPTHQPESATSATVDATENDMDASDDGDENNDSNGDKDADIQINDAVVTHTEQVTPELSAETPAQTAEPEPDSVESISGEDLTADALTANDTELEGVEATQQALQESQTEDATSDVSHSTIAHAVDEVSEVGEVEDVDAHGPDEHDALSDAGQAAASIAPAELDLQKNLMRQFSAQLETIEPELGAPPAPANQRKAPDLTSGLEFELTSEERELVEQADLLHQLELENRAAILDDDAEEWSKNEPGFDEQSLLAAFAADEALRAQDDLVSRKAPVKALSKESSGGSTEIDTPAVDSKSEEDSADDDQTQHKPGFVLQAEKQDRYGKWMSFGLSLVCLFLLLGVAAQSIFFLRSTIAAEMPATKPHLVRACQLLSCKISLPAERYMLEVTGHELLILNEELKINTLAFQIQNKSNTVQEWPALELTLVDVRGKTVLQKVFLPADYLNNKADVAKGIAARSESNHMLYFEINATKASNYLPKIFYP